VCRNPPGADAADSRREAREDKIDLADAGSALTGGRGARVGALCSSIDAELAGGFLLQSRAFRRHANGADLALLFFFLVVLLASSPMLSTGSSGCGGGRRSEGGCG
jgi:uncharacterized protein YbjT (DUF2867 family)